MNVLSSMLNSETFYLEKLRDFPIALIRDEQGFLDYEGIENTIGLLYNLLEMMSRDGTSQDEVLYDCESVKNLGLLASPYWTFPTVSLVGLRNGTPGRCVYFIYSPKNKEIKIGHTSNLTHRLWGISRSSGDERENLQVIAAVPCIEAARLERYIHRELAEYCVHGEWFEAAPVSDFIEKHSGVKRVVIA